jgi:hypothetical protein
MQHLNYWQFPGFENIYLEDSYVLGCEAKKASVEIFIEAVITEKHPLYSQPLPGEVYCYRRMKIQFPRSQRYHLIPNPMNPIPNADGSIDWGNIDEFFLADDGTYHLIGEWGEIAIASDAPKLILDAILVKNGDDSIQIDKDKIRALEWKAEGAIALVYEDDLGNPRSAQIDRHQNAAAFAAALGYLGELQGGFVTDFTGVTELTFSK